MLEANSNMAETVDSSIKVPLLICRRLLALKEMIKRKISTSNISHMLDRIANQGTEEP